MTSDGAWVHFPMTVKATLSTVGKLKLGYFLRDLGDKPIICSLRFNMMASHYDGLPVEVGICLL